VHNARAAPLSDTPPLSLTLRTAGFDPLGLGMNEERLKWCVS